MPDSSGNIKIKVKLGQSEAEVEAPLANLREAIELIPEVVAKLPRQGFEPKLEPASSNETASRADEGPPGPSPGVGAPSSTPTVTVEKGDSLSDVISKFFADPWGRSPRKLMEVRDALQSYGLNYPKQSVAVALLRLAKGSKIRRFKGEGGEYVYTAATGAARIPAPQPAAQARQEGGGREASAEAEPEEQLDLDAPATN